MVANLIDQETLKNIVSALLDGELVDLGSGYNLALDCGRSKVGDNYELSHHFSIFDNSKLSSDLLSVDHDDVVDDEVVWEKETVKELPMKENLFFVRRQMILETMQEILFDVVPSLFAKRIIETHNRANDISKQKDQWSEVSEKLINDVNSWIDHSKNDNDIYGNEM